MRQVVVWIFTMCFALCAVAAHGQQSEMRVTLVGTGGPEYVPDRLGISTLVEANGLKLLFDAGQGAGQGIYQSRINPKDIRLIFLTHLHSDHYEGLPGLWMTPWFLLGRDHGIDLYGPQGSREMVKGMRQMFGHDLKMRANKFNPVRTLDIDVHILSDGVIFDEKGVRVTAFPVEHDDGNPAFGFRVDYAGHSVVLSGDTTFSDTLVKHSVGADLIVQNIIAFSDRLGMRVEMKAVLAKLTTPEQAAAIFLSARPKMAVYSHIVTKDLAVEEIADVITKRTRAAGYLGPLVVGKDRMVFTIGDTVETSEPQSLDDLPALDTKGQSFP